MIVYYLYNQVSTKLILVPDQSKIIIKHAHLLQFNSGLVRDFVGHLKNILYTI